MLGKTRQTELVQESFDPKLRQPRGVLRLSEAAEGVFRHVRRSASPALAPWVEHYWMVFWDLRGFEPRMVGTLPHPNVNVVFEAEGSKVWGISTRKFTRELKGKGYSFGIKFAAGGFYAFLRRPVSSLANMAVPVTEVFGPRAAVLEEIILATEDEDGMMSAADSFLLERLPEPDPQTEQARELVDRILQEKDILTVEALAERTAITVRSLQRLFSRYVGASPKWVIRRYRLHELLERIHAGERLNFAALSAELGYFDQAHLIRDFKSVVGYAPTEYPGFDRK